LECVATDDNDDATDAAPVDEVADDGFGSLGSLVAEEGCDFAFTLWESGFASAEDVLAAGLASPFADIPLPFVAVAAALSLSMPAEVGLLLEFSALSPLALECATLLLRDTLAATFLAYWAAFSRADTAAEFPA
jgi:hypothetical protein